ncbi:MAG: OmpA family protein [Flavipsychrobacter sp.]|jgi:outer membrane protein OmpA-like peptidoglycan-associated protein|nr:OmpA family protein [Flavipsychrobacter sp.]
MYKLLPAILLTLGTATSFAQKPLDTFRLYFELDVAALSPSIEKKIDLLIYNDKIINGSSVMIVGYADFLGSEGYNKSLSMERARNVKKYLVTYGIDSNYVKLVEGKGKVNRDGHTDPSGYPTDRRVDIVVNNRTKRLVTETSKMPVKPRKDSARSISIRTTNVNDIKNLKPGATLLLKNVYFPPDRHVIKPESKETLEKLYTALHDYPNLRISIEGHVCCIKDAIDAWDIDTYEQSLSVNRAKAIYNYLVSRGIDSNRLKYAGFGRRRPVIADEKSEWDAEQNRRVEVRVIENK